MLCRDEPVRFASSTESSPEMPTATRITATVTDSTTATAATARAAGRTPSLHHRALYTWLSVYCMITGVQLLLGSSLVHLPLEVRTLVLTGIVVPVVVYLLVPAFARLHSAATRHSG